MARDVFISYSVGDGDFANEVHRALDAAGLSCWQAPGDIPPGTSYPEAIIEAINTCRLLLLVFSPQANSSRHVKREVERAVSKACPLLAVRIADFVPSPAMEYLLSTSQWLDATALPPEQRMARTVSLVRAFLSGEADGATAAGARMSRLAIQVEQRSVFAMPVDAVSISLGGFESYARAERLAWSQSRMRLGETTVNRIQVQDPRRACPLIYVYPERVQRQPSDDSFRDAVCDFLHAAQREGATSFAVAPTGKTAGFSRQRALRAALDGYADYLGCSRGGLVPTIGTLRFAVRETREMKYEITQLNNEIRRYFSSGMFAASYKLQERNFDISLLPIDLAFVRA